MALLLEGTSGRRILCTVAHAGYTCKTCSSSGLWQQAIDCDIPASYRAKRCLPACRAPRSSFTGWVGWLLAIFYVLALGFYGYVRVVHTLGHGGFM